MRRIKIAVLALFACSVAIFAVFAVRDFMEGNDQPPVIESTQDTISVPIDATDEQLCAGLTANDKEDGDLTGQILVTNVSNFISDCTCNISYAVFDSRGQTGSYTRKVTYTDYTPPKFAISEPLEIRMGGEVEILDKLEASDVFDGDISNRILILSSSVNTETAGLYNVTVQVSNSHGDVTELSLPVSVRDFSVSAPTIELTKTLVYLKKGAEFSAGSYIDTKKTTANVKTIGIESAVNTAEAGTYLVTYSAANQAGNIGNAYLTVVVEE